MITLNQIHSTYIRSTLVNKIEGALEETDFEWLDKGPKYRVASTGKADVKVAMANVGLDEDIWEGLRNPATIGLYPLGLQEIWEYYSYVVAPKIDDTGRSSLFHTAKSYDWAMKKYKRAVLISIMFPLAKDVFNQFADFFEEKRNGSIEYYSKWWSLSNKLLEKAVGRLALELQSSDRAVIGIIDETINNMSTKALPITRQDKAHGPCKRGNFPQKSFAALTGLGQFGINRLIMRDELVDGRTERFIGPIRSMIIFDSEDLDPQLLKLDKEWREKVYRINDFRIVDEETKNLRFCTYNSENEGCRQCIKTCPSGALAFSSPLPSGQYSEKQQSMKNRIYDGHLQFNYDMCLQERNKYTELYPEWACSRCLATCAAKGKRNPQQ